MEDEILNLFLYNERLKFSEIEKQVKTRSNKLAYHLKSLVEKGILKKEKGNYMFSEAAEVLIPYLTSKNSVISIILVAIRENKKIFLIKRNKRPFNNDKLCLPGGRLILGESIPKATERIMKEKFNVSCKFKRVNSISLEHVKRGGKTIHSFILIFVTATTKEKLSYTDSRINRNKMVLSDFHLIKNDLDKEVEINKLFSNP